MDRVDLLVHYINARLEAAQQWSAGGPPPFSPDPIIAVYRFTNVYREDDRVTRYILGWLNQNYDGNVATSAALARFINEPPTLNFLGYPKVWSPTTTATALRAWRDSGRRTFNPAYIISTNGQKMDKLDYITDIVNEVHEYVHLLPGLPLWRAARELTKISGIGTFMAGQIIGDLKHTPLLADADDWWTWATPGPGSQRGLSYVLGHPSTRKLSEPAFLAEMSELMNEVLPRLALPRRLDAQNFQNCLCEFSKYCRAVDGTGRPKQGYTPFLPPAAH